MNDVSNNGDAGKALDLAGNRKTYSKMAIPSALKGTNDGVNETSDIILIMV